MELDLKQRQLITVIIVITFLVSSVTGFVAGGLGGSYFFGKTNIINNTGNQLLVGDNSVKATGNQEELVIRTVKDASPAVVSIIVSKNLPVIKQGNPFGDFFYNWPFGNFFETPQQSPQSGSGTQKQEVGGGTGFIISSDGLILTNKHVVEDEQAEYTVLTNDGQKYDAKILARDPVRDIAVIKIEEDNLPVLKLGDSDNLQIGQSVIAIGNALAEFRNTVSVGVISGLQRSVAASGGLGQSAEQLEDVIQTDAAINPGNSGGPLLNLSGEVIGINVAMAQGAQSIGFALPISQAKRDVEQIQKSGKITYPFLGVRYTVITPTIKEQNNLPIDYGALIMRGQNSGELAVIPGSPADKAGLTENDIILEADGKKIDQKNSLAQIIQKHNVGETMTLKILHDGQEKTVKVVLGER